MDEQQANQSIETGDVRMGRNQLWQSVIADLSSRVSSRAFDNWFRQTELVSVSDTEAVIATPNAFAQSTLEKRYTGQVERTISGIIGRNLKVVFTVGKRSDEDRDGQGEANEPAKRERPQRRPVTESNNRQLALTNASARGLNVRLTFDTYVVGSSNQLVHAASQAVAENPGDRFNPLFVYGGVGLGKTHLLHAIGHKALEINPDLNVVYVTSETFTNDVINAIRAQRMEEFRSRYRLIDILMVDDIQFIAGKESTQEEFFHTFNALYQNSKQIIVSSDKPPRAIAALEDRMSSRFAGGLVADVQSPDFEMRTAILRQKAEELGIKLSPDVIEYVAHKDPSNIRELEGALNKILMMAQLYQRPLNLQLAMEALTEVAASRRRAATTSQEVIDAVLKYYKISEKDLLGRQRKREIVAPRQVAMYLLREETDGSLVDIGRALGNRDHTTVMHGIEKIVKDQENDTQLRAQIMAIRESLLTSRN